MIWLEEDSESTEMETKANEKMILQVKSKGNQIPLSHFFLEIESFCRSKKCLLELMEIGGNDFFRFVAKKNARRKIWLQTYFETLGKMLKSTQLS